MVIKANRKHQIVLNMEVKRIEMEKKMRERYFCFEMSLMKARRLKILDRQKSLGIWRPHTMESGKDPRKARGKESFFFTEPVAMDEFKLPPVSERRRTISGFPVKLANNDDSQRANKLSKNIDLNNVLHKERAKQHIATEKVKAFKDGQSKNHSKILTKESSKLGEIEAGNLVENRRPINGEIISLGDALSKNLIIENDESQLQLDTNNLGLDKFGDEKERNIQGNDTSQQKQKENGESSCNTSVQDFRAQPLKPQFSPKNIIKSEITSLQRQDMNDLPSCHELQAWRKSWETRILNAVKDFKVTSRLKSASATGNGKDIELQETCAVKVRPQTALARLLIKDECKSS